MCCVPRPLLGSVRGAGVRCAWIPTALRRLVRFSPLFFSPARVYFLCTSVLSALSRWILKSSFSQLCTLAVLRIRIEKSKQCCGSASRWCECWSGSLFTLLCGSDPTFLLDADPDLTCNFLCGSRSGSCSLSKCCDPATTGLQTLHGSIFSLHASFFSVHGLLWLHFESPQLLILTLMWIWIRHLIIMRIRFNLGI